MLTTAEALARQIEAECYDLAALEREQQQERMPPTPDDAVRLALQRELAP